MYEPDTKHCQRIVEALNLQAKTVGSPAVKEDEIGVQRGKCSSESLQKDQIQCESTDEHLGGGTCLSQLKAVWEAVCPM